MKGIALRARVEGEQPMTKQSDLYRENAENCMQLAETAQSEPAYHRYDADKFSAMDRSRAEMASALKAFARRKVSADNIAKELGRHVGSVKRKARVGSDALQEGEVTGSAAIRRLFEIGLNVKTK